MCNHANFLQLTVGTEDNNENSGEEVQFPISDSNKTPCEYKSSQLLLC
jgi:hypothetical protein